MVDISMAKGWSTKIDEPVVFLTKHCEVIAQPTVIHVDSVF